MPFAHEQYSIIDRMNDENDTDREIRKLMFGPRFSIQALLEPLVKGGFPLTCRLTLTGGSVHSAATVINVSSLKHNVIQLHCPVVL